MLSGQRKGITKTTLGGRRAMIMAALAVAGWLSIPPSAAHATTGAAGGAGQNGTYSTGGVVGTGGVGGTGTGSGSYANAGGNGGYNAAGTAGEGANSSGGGGGTFSGTGALGGVASGGGGAGGYAAGTNSGSADGGVGGGSTTHGFGGGGGGGASLPSNALGGPGGGGGGGGGGSAAVSGISTGTYTPVFNITGGDGGNGGNGGYHGVVGIGTVPTTSPITAGPNPTPGTLKLDVSVAKFAENSTITLTGSPVYYSGGGGGGGGAGIFTGATAIAITNNSTLTITGGAGGNGGYLGGGGGGGGGGGVVGSNFTLTNFGVVSGGGGGGGIPGAGGTGVSGSGFTLINHGTITGGAAATAGVGGIGVSGRGFTLANSGTIIGAAGGVGGSGGNGGNGGTGAHSTGSSIVTNDGTISGGTGGSGTIGVSTGGYGGNGGTGAYWSSSAMITNNGVISGGAGGTSGTIAGSGGSGIQGMRFTLTNNSEITGGAKGIGGGGQLGGNGGAGVMATGFTLTNNGKIAGGTGGSSGFGGAGVSGGGFTLTNNGTISGNTGYGGGGDGVEGFLTGGFTLFNRGIITGGAHFFIANGGSGVDCSTGGATITNAGSISGGLSGGSTTNYADAIDLFGGGNTLILESGYSFTGNVVSTRGTTAGDSLELGGTSSAAFDVSNVDASISGSYTGTPQYVGFANLSVVGTATWTVTGTNNSGLGWDLNGGTLAISSASTLGSSAVTLDGGTLDYTGTAAVAVSNAVVNNGAVSILENSGSGTESLTGSIANATAGNILAFSGGTFNLNEAGSGAGTFEIGDAPSTVIVSNANAFGSGAIIVNSGSTLETSDALAGSGSVLAITGSSYTQNSGSTLKLLATGNGINDSIQLGSGAASLNGELNLIFSGFTPAAGQHYTVIGTTGTVSGTFSSLVLTGAPSLLKGTANYIAGTGEVIDLSNLAYFANLSGFTPNQASVATYLNNNAVSSSTPGTIQNAMVALSSMSQQQQANYLNELTPQAYSELPQQSIQNNTFMAQQVFNQVQNAFDSGGFNTSGLTMLKTNDQDPFAVSMDAALASAQQQARNSVAYMDNSPQLVGMPGVGPIVPSQESPLSISPVLCLAPLPWINCSRIILLPSTLPPAVSWQGWITA